nr:MAG TPA: hypothetical protein [Caudoviricetes sp.]
MSFLRPSLPQNSHTFPTFLSLYRKYASRCPVGGVFSYAVNRGDPFFIACFSNLK